MNRLTARSGARSLLGLLAALGVAAALTMPALAADDFATVTGYADGTPENNSPATWEALTPEDDTCVDAGVNGVATWVLPDLPDGETYTLVVVKAGSAQSAEEVNTLFANPSEGQTVWADSTPDGVFGEGDKNISHAIVCTLVTEVPPSEAPPSEVAESEVPAESEREDTLGGTPTPAPAIPDTAMGDVGQMPATVLSLVLIGALGAMVYVRLARQR